MGNENEKKEFLVLVDIYSQLSEKLKSLIHDFEAQLKHNTPEALLFRERYVEVAHKLKDGDIHLDELIQKIATYRMNLIEQEARDRKGFDTSLPFTAQNLQAFLDFYMPYNKKDLNDTKKLFEELLEKKVGFADLVRSHMKVKPFLPEIERDLLGSNISFESELWQVGALRAEIYITMPHTLDDTEMPDGVRKVLTRWKDKII